MADLDKLAPIVQREPNKEILEHERKRQVEVRLLEWMEETKLEEKGLPEQELEKVSIVRLVQPSNWQCRSKPRSGQNCSAMPIASRTRSGERTSGLCLLLCVLWFSEWLWCRFG
jgi:hypothetical protein